jgi:hypothetical protein
MRTLISATIVLTTLACGGCGSSGSSGGGSDVAQAPASQNGVSKSQPANAAAQPARTNKTVARKGDKLVMPPPSAANLPKNPDVPVLKLDEKEVPAAVRAIEAIVDKRSALLADEVRIEISKNYEWDVSLSGDAVAPHKPDGTGTVAEAVGGPRAYFRNLDIRARDKIVVWRSGLGVAPFIRVYARGKVSYIEEDTKTGKASVKRAGTCRISNASIAFDEQILGAPAAAAQPTGLREKTK